MSNLSSGTVSANIGVMEEKARQITSTITTNAINMWNHKNFPNDLHFGSGAKTINENATSLDTHVLSFNGSEVGGWTKRVDDEVDTETGEVTCKSYLYMQSNPVSGDYVLTEVGIGNSPSELWAYGLIVDILGNPASVTLKKGEYLRIEIEIGISSKSADDSVVLSNSYAHEARLKQNGLWLLRESSPNLETGKFPTTNTSAGDTLAGAVYREVDKNTAVYSVGVGTAVNDTKKYKKLATTATTGVPTGLRMGVEVDETFVKGAGTEIKVTVTNEIIAYKG